MAIMLADVKLLSSGPVELCRVARNRQVQCVIPEPLRPYHSSMLLVGLFGRRTGQGKAKVSVSTTTQHLRDSHCFASEKAFLSHAKRGVGHG
jgi:hypothetical protein